MVMRGGDPPKAPPPAKFKGFTLKENITLLEGFNVAHYEHDRSGMNVLVYPQPGTRVVAFVTAYKVGSRNEVAGRTGLAHLFEHMMFRGTPSFPEPFKTLSGWGDSFNAYTSNDVTVYHQLVPKEVFSEVAKFEAERMRKLKITEDAYNTERGAVVSERKMRTEDNPMGRAYWETVRNTFTVHPYRTPPIGWQDDLEATTFQDALDFYKRFYAPNRAVLALVGDFSFEEALHTLAAHYGDFQKEVWVDPVIPMEPKNNRKNKRKVFNMKTEAVLMTDSVLGNSFSDPWAEADMLLCTLLADADYGYLSEELVRKKTIFSHVGMSCSPGIDPGLLLFWGRAKPGVKIAEAEAAYSNALKGFPKFLTQKKLDRVKLLYLASQWSSFRAPIHLATGLASSMATAGRADADFVSLQKMQKVELEEVLNRFQFFLNAKRTRVFLNPSSQTDPLVRSQD